MSPLSLLADPVRARNLYPLDTCDDTVGYALRILRTAGLVTGRRHGRMVFYRLTDDFPAPLREYCLRRWVRCWRAGRISILG